MNISKVSIIRDKLIYDKTKQSRSKTVSIYRDNDKWIKTISYDSGTRF